MTLHSYKVGDLYNPNRTTWPETPVLRMTRAGVELVLFYASPTDGEITAIKKGHLRWAWVDGEHVGVMAYRIGNLPWSDTPYTPHREQPGDTPGLADTGDNGLVAVVLLVDATTGVIAAIRATTWPARFVKAVRGSVDRMLSMPFNGRAHDEAVTALYARHPDSAEMARVRADAACSSRDPA